VVEAGVVAVAHPLAGLEAREQPVLHLAEQADMLGIDREVAERCAAGEACGVLGGQAVGAPPGVEEDDARGDHDRQPLAHIALGERRLLGDLGARRGRQPAIGVEEAGAVADPDHHGDRAVVDEARDAVEKGVGLAGVEIGRLDVLCHVSLQAVCVAALD
jgi:hypothetical protein